MKEMAELQFVNALAQGQIVKEKIELHRVMNVRDLYDPHCMPTYEKVVVGHTMEPVLVKSSRTFSVMGTEVKILSYVADIDNYLGDKPSETLTAHDICYIYKGRIHLVHEYVRTQENLEMVVLFDIENHFQGSWFHQSVAEA